MAIDTLEVSNKGFQPTPHKEGAVSMEPPWPCKLDFILTRDLGEAFKAPWALWAFGSDLREGEALAAEGP